MNKLFPLVLLALTACGASVATGTDQEPHKVFVCKYVGTPGDDERLQTGQNPISVDIAALRNFVTIGAFFNDEQGRSIAIAFDVGQPEPGVDECPSVTPPNDDDHEHDPDDDEHVIDDHDDNYIAYIHQHHHDVSRLRDQHRGDHPHVYDWAADDDRWRYDPPAWRTDPTDGTAGSDDYITPRDLLWPGDHLYDAAPWGHGDDAPRRHDDDAE